MNLWKRIFGSAKSARVHPPARLPFNATTSVISPPPNNHRLEEMLQSLGTKAWTSSRSRNLGPTGFLFLPVPLSPRDERSLNNAVKLLYEHARRWAPGLDIPYRVPLIKLQSNFRAAGQFQIDDEGWVTICIASRYLDHPSAVWLILAHEVCHHVLNQSGINIRQDTERNEILTDIAMFVCGFGELARSGFRLITRRGDEYTQTHLGYLQAAEYSYAYRWILAARKRNELSGMQGTPASDYTLASDFIILSESATAEAVLKQKVPEAAQRDRLIAYQQSKYPNLSRAELIIRATEAIEQDNR